MSTLEGKVVLISGGARGQGASHGRRLGEAGARVVLADVLDDAGAQTAEELRASGIDATYEHLDVTSLDDWRRVVQRAEERHGRLDTLINNAGIVHLANAVEESEEDFDRTMAVNAKGVFLGMKAGIPAMQRAGGGAIVNISSVYGIVGAPEYLAYNASKAAVLLMTRSAALAHAKDGIRINAICPGTVYTPQQASEPVGHVLAATPMERGADPREISQGVLFLVSDASSFVTGTTLVMDGGFLAH
jgi:3alpha(or 20beta)-hydroxysteroid dehydrogenase